MCMGHGGAPAAEVVVPSAAAPAAPCAADGSMKWHPFQPTRHAHDDLTANRRGQDITVLCSMARSSLGAWWQNVMWVASHQEQKCMSLCASFLMHCIASIRPSGGACWVCRSVILVRAQVLYSTSPNNHRVSCKPSSLSYVAHSVVNPGDSVPSSKRIPSQASTHLHLPSMDLSAGLFLQNFPGSQGRSPLSLPSWWHPRGHRNSTVSAGALTSRMRAPGQAVTSNGAANGVCNADIPNDSVYKRYLYVISALAANGFYVVLDNHVVVDNTYQDGNKWAAMWAQVCHRLSPYHYTESAQRNHAWATVFVSRSLRACTDVKRAKACTCVAQDSK